MSKNKLPESASLDHTKVKAPYVRLSSVIEVEKGCKGKIYKYDLRFVQPNKAYIPIASLHSLEHLLAVEMRKHLDKILDISPMGCQTGFYLLTMHSYEEVIDGLAKALKYILAAKNIPFSNIKQCGRAKSHSLPGAKKYAKKMLAGKDNWLEGGQTSKTNKQKTI
jgi:S-ribosylhomocysteine lyase